MTILLKKLDEKAILPSKKHDEDAGFDISTIEDIYLFPGEQKVYKTGLELVNIDQPDSSNCMRDVFADFRCALFVWPKSGIDAKFGVRAGAGVIDHIYRGEILLLLKNEGKEAYLVKAGTPVVQLIPMLYMNQDIQEVKESGSSERGNSGGINKTAVINTPVTLDYTGGIGESY